MLTQATWFPLCVRGLVPEGACFYYQFRSNEALADSLQKTSQPQLPCRLISLVTLHHFSCKSHLSLKFSLIETAVLVWSLSCSFLVLLKPSLVPHLQFHTRAVFPPLMPSVPVADSTNRTHFRALVFSRFVYGSFSWSELTVLKFPSLLKPSPSPTINLRM